MAGLHDGGAGNRRNTEEAVMNLDKLVELIRRDIWRYAFYFHDMPTELCVRMHTVFDMIFNIRLSTETAGLLEDELRLAASTSIAAMRRI
jgi:hypothetical protein